MYEMLPYFSGRSTLEGVYNQAGVLTHPVYYLASELGASSPNPFRKREYARFDTDAALRHLRLFGVGEVVAISAKLAGALESRLGVSRVLREPPYTVFRLDGDGGGYVEPLRFAPVRSPREGWRDKSYRWFTRKPFGGPVLVFTDDPAFDLVERDEWLAPPPRPLPPGTQAHATVADEQITITTDRVGHPLLVKVGYHPRWRAEGADGPYLASPGLMVVVPREPLVRLTYARARADAAGLALTLLALAGAVAHAWVRRRRRAEPAPAAVVPADACDVAPPPRRWGAAVPAAVLGLLLASRATQLLEAAPDPMPLFEAASRAAAEGRSADAAEYARHAIPRVASGDPLRLELLCLRGEALLATASPELAAEAFDEVLQEGTTPWLPQALAGSARAHDATGDRASAEVSRSRLAKEYAGSPWVARAGS
jgi:hypothetical protein